MYSLSTVPALYALGVVDFLIALACWQRSRHFAKRFLDGCFLLKSEQH